MPPSELVPDYYRPITIGSDAAMCTVLADKGADLYSFVHRTTGIDVLFKTPWGPRDPTLTPPYEDSRADWLARYPGGWQLVLPNVGDPTPGDGIIRGFHGEAASIPWQVEDHDDSHIVLTTRLLTAPLRLTREITVRGASLEVNDHVANDSPVPLAVAWSEHVAFGTPFLGKGSRVRTAATRFVSDSEAPGTVLAPGISTAVGDICDTEGRPVDLGILPDPGQQREVFGTLTDFDSGWCRVESPSAGLAVELEWPLDVLPHAWWWQECSATAGFPWFKRAHVLGIEPANIFTTADPVTGAGRTRPPTLGPRESWRAGITLRLVRLDR